jgi:exopolyphosphatase/guanosine-5'-triphosphate,3'-diphosphate pyrophosphatase
MRVGVVDLGTNSTRLLVADVHDDHVDEVARRLTITRLGEGVDERRKLLPSPVARVRNVLSDYRRELEQLGAERVLAIGTSAVRDADNGEAFLGEVEWSYGFTSRLLSGEEEAELTRRGVANGRALGDETLVLDVGGGSTELIAGAFHVSLDVGSVRLAERFGESLDEGAAFVHSLLPALEVRTAVGVGGTVAQLDRLVGELTLEAVECELERLAALPLEERRRVPGLDPDRAPVIVTGALVVREVLRRYGLARLDYSERDILDGIVQIMSRLRHLA